MFHAGSGNVLSGTGSEDACDGSDCCVWLHSEHLICDVIVVKHFSHQVIVFE